MHRALYRKYRPKIFDDVCGQEHITSVLKYQCASGKVSHAYLFCGSRGTGKTSCAKILAKSVNCTNLQNGNPCGECEACRDIDSGAATDVLEIDAASNNGVDNIRELREDIAYTPSTMKKRVYIIDEVHMLSASAFNALLKTLEEPPEYAVFILATTELHKLPATIISRCQRFDFRRLTVDSLCSRLRYIADKEEISLTDDAAARIAKIAEGGMRDAISLLELCAGGGASVDSDRVVEIIGLSGYETVSAFAEAVSSKNTAGLIEMIAGVQSSSKDIIVFWQELVSYWRDMMIMKVADDPVKYLDLTEAEYETLKKSAGNFTVAQITYQSAIFESAMKDMLRSPQSKRVIAEFASLRLASPALDSTPEAMLARISELEDRLTLLESGAVKISASSVNAPENTDTNVNEKAKEPENTAIFAEPEKVNPTVAYDTEIAKPSKEPDGYTQVFDTQAVIEKLGVEAEMYKSFLMNSNMYVSGDSSVIKIVAQNAFAAKMFESENVKNLISRAALLAKVTDKLASVKVTLDDEKQNDNKKSDPFA